MFFPTRFVLDVLRSDTDRLGRSWPVQQTNILYVYLLVVIMIQRTVVIHMTIFVLKCPKICRCPRIAL